MITKKQKEMLDFISKYSEKHGYAPSLEEIRVAFKLASVSTPYHYVRKLQEEGYIKKDDNRPRAISVYPGGEIKSPFLKKSGLDAIRVPILGSANAGPATIFAEENISGYLKVSRNDLNKKGGIFALRVEGDSMDKARIRGKNLETGDFVLIDSEYRNPENGDYVLSVIDGCANLKRFKRDNKTGEVTLVSESTNPKNKPIHISSDDDFMVNGKIISIVKK